MDTNGRYCIRNFKGEYLTHSVDVERHTEHFYFTPSPWMARVMSHEEATALAREYGGLVMTWEKPEEPKRNHGRGWNERMASAIRGLKTEGRNA